MICEKCKKAEYVEVIYSRTLETVECPECGYRFEETKTE